MNQKWKQKVRCLCNCGEWILKYGSNRQLRKYKKGHHKPWLGRKRIDMIGNSWGGNRDYFEKHKFSGTKHPKWKGGRWLYWRKQALQRDDYTCQNCGLREIGIMQVDHNEPLKGKDRYTKSHNLKNLITLCPNCHARKTLKEWHLNRRKK